MEIEKLIEKLRTESLYKDKATLEIMDLCMDAALALEQLRDESEKLKAQVPRWIPLEERLPEPTENPVLAFDCTGPVMAWYSPTMGWMYRTGIAGCEITHWMHLPQPPKEEKKSD